MAKSKEQIKLDLLEHIKDLISENEPSWKRLISKIRIFNKRYEAQRSILGITHGDEILNMPFEGASDFGFPIEAITIDNLVVREFKAKYEDSPICKVRAIKKDDKEKSEPAEQYLDFKLNHKIPNFKLTKKMADRIKGVEGGYIAKIINGEYKEWVTEKQKGYQFKNTMTDTYFREEGTEEPAVFPENEIPIELIDNEAFTREETEFDGERKYYQGVRYILKHYEDVMWDMKNATTPFIEDLDWFIDLPEYSEHELQKLKKKDIPKDSKKAIDDLIKAHKAKNNKDRQKKRKEKLELIEWWGSYDVNNDGFDEEIRVLMSKEHDILIGWEENEFGGQKPFFHHYFKERKKGFHGVGVVEFFEGIRNVLDALINQNFNRRLINDNPPILVGEDSGFDPDLCELGPGEVWPLENETRIKVLDLPKGEQSNMNDLQFLMGLSQKIYGGVSDYSTGNVGDTSKNRTASGIKAIISQGNIMFNDIVKQDQIVNGKEYLFMMKHLFPLDLEEVENEAFLVLGQDDPFKEMSLSGLQFEMILEPVTTDLDEHPDIRYRKFVEIYTMLLQAQEPLFLKDHDLRAKVVNEILKAGFKGELKTKGAAQLRLEELLIKQKALEVQINQIATIQQQKEKQAKMNAAAQIGQQLGVEVAKAKQLVERNENEQGSKGATVS
ncbi:MAG: hypothetical protein ACFFG0_03485 [Candidatus Thorarchaeota archaeon]